MLNQKRIKKIPLDLITIYKMNQCIIARAAKKSNGKWHTIRTYMTELINEDWDNLVSGNPLFLELSDETIQQIDDDNEEINTELDKEEQWKASKSQMPSIDPVNTNKIAQDIINKDDPWELGDF